MARIRDRVAYATFYCTRLKDESDKDPYFDAVQLLIYQILHRPSTCTQLGIPVLVFVVPHVSERRRNVFRSMGACVIELDYVPHPGIHPRRERWIDQLCKLRIFQQVSYDRILYLDADMLLTKSLDAIWSEPVSSQRYETRAEVEEDPARLLRIAPLPGQKLRPHAPESQQDRMSLPRMAPLPDKYLFVAVSDTYANRKPDPPVPCWYTALNSGFWLASPSLEMFEYYTSLLAFPDSYDSQYMEQGIFRYAHGDDGPMPWQQFERKWNVNWPRAEDLRCGTATLHDRFWITDEPWTEPELVQAWDEAVKEMQAFRRGMIVQDDASAVPGHERLSSGCSRSSRKYGSTSRRTSVECAA
ncbi:exostoses (multiple)-like 2 [Elasticomyces elasticus]|uniref:Exostoses (Multiple)-like 2 n=1 Tax=Elasticomyces elasticus TaxID=574655 RepID=A0AAN7W469_9PEZI|nr:exostoses (multiple)-like 2 [Elasticomyces elasticus]